MPDSVWSAKPAIGSCPGIFQRSRGGHGIDGWNGLCVALCTRGTAIVPLPDAPHQRSNLCNHDVGRNIDRIDPRLFATAALLMFATASFWRADFAPNAEYRKRPKQ